MRELLVKVLGLEVVENAEYGDVVGYDNGNGEMMEVKIDTDDYTLYCDEYDIIYSEYNLHELSWFVKA